MPAGTSIVNNITKHPKGKIKAFLARGTRIESTQVPSGGTTLICKGACRYVIQFRLKLNCNYKVELYIITVCNDTKYMWLLSGF